MMKLKIVLIFLSLQFFSQGLLAKQSGDFLRIAENENYIFIDYTNFSSQKIIIDKKMLRVSDGALTIHFKKNGKVYKNVSLIEYRSGKPELMEISNGQSVGVAFHKTIFMDTFLIEKGCYEMYVELVNISSKTKMRSRVNASKNVCMH